MDVGTVAAWRIGLAVLRRLKPFDVKLHYTDRHRLPETIENELRLTFHPTDADMVPVCDVVTITCPLHPETENLFEAKMISSMRRGAYLVNTARGKICNRDAVAAALQSGHLAGYAGDAWFPQPAPQDHPWRTMPHHRIPPERRFRHKRGTQPMFEKSSNAEIEHRPIWEEYLIVGGGKLAGTGAHSYSAGTLPAAPKRRPNSKRGADPPGDEMVLET